MEGGDGEVNLEASLTALSRLSSGRLSLEDLLVRVAEYAAHAIPGADGAGLTLLEPDRADIIVKSTEFVRQGCPRDERCRGRGQGQASPADPEVFTWECFRVDTLKLRRTLVISVGGPR